jgi:hypothetical protein
VNLSRGGKEGNNAFTYDSKLRKSQNLDFLKVFKHEPSMEILKLLKTKAGERGESFATNN